MDSPAEPAPTQTAAGEEGREAGRAEESLEQFCRKLPKIELHAHLSGSITRETLHSIWLDRKRADPALDLADPLELIPEGGIDDVEAFFRLFSRFTYHLCNDVASVRTTTRAVLDAFAADGVVYLELRTTPRSQPGTAMSKPAYVEAVLDAIDAHQPSPMATRLILSVDRRDSPAAAHECVDLAIRYRARGVVGVDLCGNPLHKGDISVFGGAFARAKAAGLGTTLHFAEMPPAAGGDDDAALLTLLSFAPDRLGHVIHVSEPVRAEIAARRLPLELCLTCNIKLKMDPVVSAHGEHHFRHWWADKSCPIVLCTDDVGVLGSPCSNEYCLVARHFGLSRLELWQLSKGAIEAIFDGEPTKQSLRDAFAAWWDERC